MNITHNFTMISLCICLVACASNRPRTPDIEETFITDITEENIKQFSYSAEMSMPNNRGSMGGRGNMGGRGGMGGPGGMGGRGMGGRGGMSGGNRPDPEEMQKRMEERFEQLLTDKLEELKYCREGYEIIDSHIGRGYAQIRGQCNDLANNEDFEKFKKEE